MRSSIGVMLNSSGDNFNMNYPDYQQSFFHHSCLLILVRGIGPNKPRSLQKVFERIQKVNNVKIKDSSGEIRDIHVRYVRDHAVENNDWGDFQTHRRLLGLITVGKFDSQGDLNELCRVHESLKVKYTSTVYDSRAILFAPPTKNENSIINEYDKILEGSIHATNGEASATFKLESEEQKILVDNNLVMPTIFKSRGFFYVENSSCSNLETRMTDFISSLFWILESKRLERSREKFDKVSLLLAPFEKKDFVGLDMESRNNKKRIMGRVTKNLADLTLQCGLVKESLSYYQASCETLRAIGDSLWLGSATEGICVTSAILLYSHLRYSVNFQRNISLQENTTSQNSSPQHNPKNFQRSSDGSQQLLQRKIDLKITLDKSKQQNESSVSSASSGSSIMSAISNSSSANSLSTSSNDSTDKKNGNNGNNSATSSLPSNILQPEEISTRYREAIINYSKYRMAGVIETESALKAARICIEQNQNLDVAMFLQNVLYINLNMNEMERVRRFETLTELYQRIGYNRKAAFCQRLAAWRHIAQSNTNPDWGQSYRLMLESFSGHKLSLEPTDVLLANQGWPCLQIDLLQQLVGTARRLGQSGLATRHMTFLLQTQWKHLSAHEQKEMALQLQNLSSQCEGAPVPLVLENGTVIPPANLTDLPFCISFQLKDLPSHLRPQKITSDKIDNGPFLFTPIHFNSSIDRRTVGAKKRDNKLNFIWVQHDLSEISLKLLNPLPFELKVGDMRLLANGIVFESLPQSIVLQSNIPTAISLHGTPLEVGELELNGYSTHTLGVKSNCRLKNMLDRDFPANYKINVIPALPKLEIKTSLPQTATFIGGGTSSESDVITSANVTLFNGETHECIVTLTNTSNVVIEYLECTLHSTYDAKIQNRLFTFSDEEIQAQLPLQPNDSLTLKLTVFGDADFIGPITNAIGSLTGAGASLTPHYHSNDGPSSLSGGVNSLMSGIGNSLPSRVSSPIRRNNEHTSSFRSSGNASGTSAVNSGHSSLQTLSLGGILQGGNHTRQLDAQLRFRYSGAQAYVDGYCRQCAIVFNLELMPSAQITNWDVLPAEIPSQFYLVLDVINLTAQEMSLNYTHNKTILIEAKESCRVPVPVERCPLDKILADYYLKQQHTNDYENKFININGTYQMNEVDLPEKLCSEHIASLVNLKWQLPATDTQGVATLRGISLSPSMIDLVTVAPIQWDVMIEDKSIAPQSEVTCTIGRQITMNIQICNNQATTLHNLLLSCAFYQDYQNGIHNYRLETRVTMSGPNFSVIPSLSKDERASHQFSVLFFTPGRFKVDIQCKTNQSSSSALSPMPASVNLSNDTHHIWKFIPSIEITVTE